MVQCIGYFFRATEFGPKLVGISLPGDPSYWSHKYVEVELVGGDEIMVEALIERASEWGWIFNPATNRFIRVRSF